MHQSLSGSGVKPVLMIPLRRCGSHAIRLRLNRSPDFYSPYPLHLVDFLPLVPLYGDLGDDRAYFRLVLDMIGLQRHSLVPWDGVTFEPAALFDDIKHLPRSVHRVAWAMLSRAAAHHGARVAMDKSLDTVHEAEALIDAVPDMLFVNVVRDPRAQVASMNRAIIHDFDTTLNALTWVRAQQAAARLEARLPQRVLTVTYEAFLADEVAVLRRICDFIGIAFLPDMIEIGSSTEAKRIAGLSALWSSNAERPNHAHRDKFRTQLLPDEIEMIETLAAAEMRRFGYEPVTRASAALPDAADLAACRARSEAGRARAWERLSQEDPRDYAIRQMRARFLDSVRASLVPVAA
jgi:hypothetical protein